MNLINGFMYKPKRNLYYMEPTKEEKQAFFEGVLPIEMLPYNGAYGTYDCPGLFILRNGDSVREVIGIEYRPDDEMIKYPVGLDVIELEGSFMASAVVADTDRLDEAIIVRSIEEMTSPKNALSTHNNLIRPIKDSDVIEIFTLDNHNRILVRTNTVTKDEYFEKPNLTTDLEKQLYYEVNHDMLIDHYNWRHINPLISGYGLVGIQDFAFVHFDIKEFRALNVVYGHEVANDVLRKIAKNLKEQDWIYHSARCADDNFALMIKDMPEDVMHKTLLDFFEKVSVLDIDPNYHIYYRCGVVPMRNTILLGDRVADAGKQIQRLGTKLYETEVLFYKDSLHDAEDWSIKTKMYLDTAIRNDEFLIHLQPKYDINTEELCGAEALIRWKYRGKGLLSPFRFIPIFETGGLISKLDDIVLHKVCQNLKRWKEEGTSLYPISVNLSRKSLGSPNLVDHLTAIVDKYDVDHSLIDFELTESAAYDDQENMIHILRELKKRGFRISMDDFGTGYSSLSLLSVLPLDTIKIDKSFVDEIGVGKHDEKECIILSHIIGMGKELSLTCLAEGVEDRFQIDRLRELGLEIVQGYYYDKPLPVEEYETRIK